MNRSEIERIDHEIRNGLLACKTYCKLGRRDACWDRINEMWQFVKQLDEEYKNDGG